jgi:hypothetical protein
MANLTVKGYFENLNRQMSRVNFNTFQCEQSPLDTTMGARGL